MTKRELWELINEYAEINRYRGKLSGELSYVRGTPSVVSRLNRLMEEYEGKSAECADRLDAELSRLTAPEETDEQEEHARIN